MKRALVIEDNDDNMKLITFLLEHHGFQTIRAWTGEEGLRAAASEQPDFVILDIQLPGMDGYEVLARLRSQADQTGRLPVIAMTSFAMAGDREKLLAAGCDGYIEKPIDPMLVMAQIEAIIGEQP